MPDLCRRMRSKLMQCMWQVSPEMGLMCQGEERTKEIIIGSSFAGSRKSAFAVTVRPSALTMAGSWYFLDGNDLGVVTMWHCDMSNVSGLRLMVTPLRGTKCFQVMKYNWSLWERYLENLFHGKAQPQPWHKNATLKLTQGYVEEQTSKKQENKQIIKQSSWRWDWSHVEEVVSVSGLRHNKLVCI